MRFLFQFLVLSIVVYLFRRFIAGFAKPSPKTASTDSSNLMVKDPVCGMHMDSRLAVRLENRNETIHFCSEECKKKYINKSGGTGIGTAAAG
jgi:YHS domain-containing protein